MVSGMRISVSKGMHVDCRYLEAEARRSEDGEAYVLLFRSESCRIGATATVQRNGDVYFSVEILINAMKMDSPELLSELSNLLETIRALKQRDFSLSHQDDGWILVSKEFRPDSINDELDQIARMLYEGGIEYDS
jgi:hypothetical protein